jgi:hypothetical protein
MKPAVLFVLSLASVVPVRGQETQLGADFRGEGERLAASCGTFTIGGIGGCAQTLFTDHPMHIAVGSIAPQNGFAAGPAFVAHWTPNESWRLSWDMDAVVSENQSWRAGAYMTAVRSRRRSITTGPSKSKLAVEEYPVFHAYAQAISLNKITSFGEGPSSPVTAQSYFGMRETIVGANVIWPVAGALHLSLYGEANGRFVDIRPGDGQPVAPVLGNQPAFAQLGEGIRLTPALAGGHVRFNYALTFQEYAATGQASSFRRFTADLSHEFPLYSRTAEALNNNFNGPDDCRPDIEVKTCPAVKQTSRNRTGSFGLRFLYTGSFVSAGNTVPFYFQPTLGGSDIDGAPFLSSYQDYRFRAPDVLGVRGSFEHSVWGPFGFTAMVDEGKVALQPGDLGFSHLAHSYAAGVTVRAGGLPAVFLMFAWGGHEGTHTIASIDTSLLGGSARPSLY